MEVQAYCFISDIFIHEHFQTQAQLMQRNPTAAFLYAKLAKLWKPTQNTNTYSQLLMNSQSSIAFRVKHATPVYTKRNFTEISLYTSD